MKIKPEIPSEIVDAIAQRGPDHRAHVQMRVSAKWRVDLHASVLHLRGPASSENTQNSYEQPVVCESSGDVFLWNGELFASDDCESVRAKFLDAIQLIEDALNSKFVL